MIVFFAVYNLQGTVHYMIAGIEQLVIEIIILIKLTADDCFHLRSYHGLRLSVIREIHRNSCLFSSLAYGFHHIISRQLLGSYPVCPPDMADGRQPYLGNYRSSLRWIRLWTVYPTDGVIKKSEYGRDKTTFCKF